MCRSIFIVLIGVFPLQAKAITIIDLGTFAGGNSSAAYGINNAGQVIGTADTKSSGSRAFLFSSGSPKENLGTLGGSHSIAYGINEAGVVVGLSTTLDGQTHAFRRNGAGPLLDLGTLGGGTYSAAYSINNANQIVGTYTNSDGVDHAFLYSGVMQDMATLGGPSSRSYGAAINNAGQITGFFSTNGENHAFLNSSGVFQDLGTLPGGNYSLGYAINDIGQVVGSASTAGVPHVFQYSSGMMQDLGALGNRRSVPIDNNNLGQIVGYAEGLGAFYYSNEVFYNLNSFLPPDSGWDLIAATGINDSGKIVGVGFHNGKQRGFLITPEPVSVEIAILAAFLIGIFARKI